MTIKQLSGYLLDEELCEHFLLEKGVLKAYGSCPACNSTHLGRVRRQCIKCYECKHEWNIRKGSVLEGSHMNLSIFIGCLKLFSDDMPASKCAAELEISQDTVWNIYQDFRQKLLEELPVLQTNSSKLSIFIESEGNTILMSLEDSNQKNSAQLSMKRTVNKDKVFIYDINFSNLRIKNILKGMDKINELDDFNRYCKEHVLSFRGRDTQLLLWRLKELTFRYNHRHDQIFNILLSTHTILEG